MGPPANWEFTTRMTANIREFAGMMNSGARVKKSYLYGIDSSFLPLWPPDQPLDFLTPSMSDASTTPMMKQYLAIRRELPEDVVPPVFWLGDSMSRSLRMRRRPRRSWMWRWRSATGCRCAGCLIIHRRDTSPSWSRRESGWPSRSRTTDPVTNKLVEELGGTLKFWQNKVLDIAVNISFHPDLSLWQINKAYEHYMGLSPEFTQNLRKKQSHAKHYIAALSSISKQIEKQTYSGRPPQDWSAVQETQKCEEVYVSFIEVRAASIKRGFFH